MVQEETVKVAVRCRPFNEREKSQKESNIISIDSSHNSVKITDPEKKRDKQHPFQQFTFDFSFDADSQQKQVYDRTTGNLVENVLQGFNATIFAYGQTGTGKSFTMEGIRADPDQRGLIPNSFIQIFEHVNNSANKEKYQYLVRCSYLEIYNEEVRDLLSDTPETGLEIKEHDTTGFYVKGLQETVVTSVDDMNKLMDTGSKNRSIGETAMNSVSSRSHSIFTIIVESCEKADNLIKIGKLNLVDLAGSERQSKTQATGQRLKEATKINLSLSTLALVEGKDHVPYRDSKLTKLLRDSLGGNAKTLMMATLSPAAYNYEETISTLRYASRAKNIKNKPVINEDPKDSLLRQYKEKVELLQKKLAVQRWKSNKVYPMKVKKRGCCGLFTSQ